MHIFISMIPSAGLSGVFLSGIGLAWLVLNRMHRRMIKAEAEHAKRYKPAENELSWVRGLDEERPLSRNRRNKRYRVIATIIFIGGLIIAIASVLI